MPKVTHVKAARQRYVMVPVTDESGNQVQTETTRKTRAKPGRDSHAITRRQTRPDLGQPLPPRNCGSCGKPIAIGTPYKWMAPRSGPFGGRKLYRHESCPAWQHWEYSDSLSAQLAHVSFDFWNALGNAEDAAGVTEVLGNAASEIREIAGAKRESAQNIEDGFQHPTEQSEELNQIADDLDSWADEVENADVPEYPEPEEDTPCGDCDGEAGDTGCGTCHGKGTYTPDEPTEEQADEWRLTVEADLSVIDEPPV